MTRDLIILGAGGFSGSIAAAADDLNRIEPQWRVLGFLDDDPEKQNKQRYGHPVLGPIAAATHYPTALFVIGVASHRARSAREAIVRTLDLPAHRFATLVHPTASISPSAHLGAGTVVLQNTVVNHGVTVGDHVLISEHCSLGHDSAIGPYVTMAAGVILAGFAKIHDGAYLGAGSRIMESITIGQLALIGIGAVSLKDVAPRTTVFGNPARPLKGRHHE